MFDEELSGKESKLGAIPEKCFPENPENGMRKEALLRRCENRRGGKGIKAFSSGAVG